MGVVFAAVYVELWETGKIRHTIRNGIILGAVSGIAGLLIWKGTFKAHPFPPRMKYGHSYLQRIPAHIVLAVFATITYRLIKKRKVAIEPLSQVHRLGCAQIHGPGSPGEIF